MPRHQFDVFLSYSRADAVRVAVLRDALQRLGYRVFYDVESIDPGSNWKKRLETAIGASRTLVLCWSEHTRGSEFVAYEYTRADALHKPVYPWLLDGTPLPSMLSETNAITLPDAEAVAERLKPSLGKTLTQRRRMQQLLVAAAVIVAGMGFWWKLKPPPPPPPAQPWSYVVTVNETGGSQLPLPGVEVRLFPTPGSATELAHQTTSPGGRAEFHLAPPRPATIFVTLTKPGYAGDKALKSTQEDFKADLPRAGTP